VIAGVVLNRERGRDVREMDTGADSKSRLNGARIRSRLSVILMKHTAKSIATLDLGTVPVRMRNASGAC